MAKLYGDIPCAKLGDVIHITASGIWCACGREWSYGRPSRSEHKCVNIIWRDIDAVTCPICKERWEEAKQRGMRILPKTDIDPWTGAELHPGDPDHCQGNGEHPDYEICCDNCNYFLACFPEYDKKQ